MSTNKTIKITTNNILFDIIYLCILSYSFTSYFLYSYITLPNNIKEHHISKLFLTMIINLIIYSMIDIIKIYYKIKYYGNEINEKIWNVLLPTNRFPLSLLKLIIISEIIVGAWICSIFLPIDSNNCSIYNDYYHACKSMQIISVLTLIMMIIIGIILLILFIVIIISCCQGYFCEIFKICCNNENNNNRFIPTFILKIIKNNMPNFTSNEVTCAICIEDLYKNPSILECGHKFHKECFTKWYIFGNNTCPTCRSPQNTLNNVVTI